MIFGSKGKQREKNESADGTDWTDLHGFLSGNDKFGRRKRGTGAFAENP
jgi:hypothetical protein